MGGSGSGRWGGVAIKRTVEACQSLVILAGGRVQLNATNGRWGMNTVKEPWGTMLKLRGERDGWTVLHEVELAFWTPRFGGQAVWLLCPACGSKRRALYAPPGHARFRCRRCWGLTYQSCQEAHAFDRGAAAFILAPLALHLGCSLKEAARALRE